MVQGKTISSTPEISHTWGIQINAQSKTSPTGTQLQKVITLTPKDRQRRTNTLTNNNKKKHLDERRSLEQPDKNGTVSYLGLLRLEKLAPSSLIYSKVIHSFRLHQYWNKFLNAGPSQPTWSNSVLTHIFSTSPSIPLRKHFRNLDIKTNEFEIISSGLAPTGHSGIRRVNKKGSKQ